MSVGALNQDAPFAGRAGRDGASSGEGAPSSEARPTQPVKLGRLTLPNRYFLAPLAGVSDWPFRLLCREQGASIAHTEMISSHGLVYGGDQTLTYLERPQDERPFAIQVFGHDPDVLAAGARVAVEQYGPVDAVDINMGCPVKKVCNHGAGAALLKDPAAVERAVRKVVEAVGPLPVTVKLRDGETVKGWIEYFDDGMLRLTRENKPNLFIYKHQIRTITESGKRRGPSEGSLVSGVSAPRWSGQ